MPDREKVIKGLECCTRYEVGKELNNCLDCPYVERIGFNQFRCKIQEMKEDALALLKEQEEQKFFDVQDDWFCVDESGKITPLAVVVRCNDCKHRPTQTEPPKTYGFSIEFPEGSKCPCQCDDGFYSWYPNDDWFCPYGERKEER